MSGLPFQLDEIRNLAELLREANLSEIEISGKDGHLRLARAAAAPSAAPSPAPVAIVPERATPAAAPEPAEHPGTIKSPMVGIVYLSSEPGAPPYVTLGQSVEEGQTLLLIEAMKTFNQIKAPKSGTVLRVLVASGTPVEYGEPLMILE